MFKLIQKEAQKRTKRSGKAASHLKLERDELLREINQTHSMNKHELRQRYFPVTSTEADITKLGRVI